MARARRRRCGRGRTALSTSATLWKRKRRKRCQPQRRPDLAPPGLKEGPVPNGPRGAAPLWACQDRLVDVSDVVEPQKAKMAPAATAAAHCYNETEKQRSFYSVPHASAVRPFH